MPNATNQADFLGEGTNASPAGAYDPNDEPNPANPGGISNNELRRRENDPARQGHRGYTRTATGAPMTGVPLTTAGYYAGNQATRDAYNKTYRENHPVARVDLNPFNTPTPALKRDAAVTGALPVAGTPGGVQPVGSRAPGSSQYTQQAPAQSAGVGGAGNTRGLPASPAAAGISPPGTPPANPAVNVPDTAGPAPAPVTVDRSQYDAAAEDLRATRTLFQDQLRKLSGLDPFGNQAFIQKATDRSVAQAAGTAAGAHGGAAAQAGAIRAQQGVQSQLSARGTQEVAEAGRRDAVTAAGLGLETVKGIGSVNAQLATNEIALTDRLNQAAELNIRQYLGGRELDQTEKDSVRRFSAEVAKIDQQRYATDVAYRESVNANLTAMYQSDNALKGAMAAVEAGENLSGDEWLMGIMGLGAGLATAGMKTSDRREKTAFRPAKSTELREFLRNGRGEHYQYRRPDAPGQAPGEHFGPMAQDLAKSKIGRTVVVEKAGVLQVDTGRLALADHSALSALAARVERLARRIGNAKKR